MKQAIVSGKWTPSKFKDLNSKEARKQLTDILGNEEQAKNVNLLFEKKLLLKNQELAMYNFVRDVTGLNEKQKKEMSERVRKTFADKKRMIENPKENERVLAEIVNDTYNKKYKLDIDLETTEELMKFSSAYFDVKERLDKILDENGNFEETKENLKLAEEYGAKEWMYFDYIKELKQNAKQKTYNKLTKKQSISDNLKTIRKNIKEFGIGGAYKFVSETTRALKATFDNSFVGRQARKTMQPRHKKAWWNMFWKSFRDIFKILTADFSDGNWKKLVTKQGAKSFFFNTASQAKAKAIEGAVYSEIFSRKNSINGRYSNKKGKLDIGVQEEDIPTLDLERIPVLGKLFIASDIAYKVSALRLRADVADNLYALAESKNTFLSNTFRFSPKLKKRFEREAIDLTNDFEVASINKVVNDMTGRGAINMGENIQRVTNNLFFSIKFAQSQINTLLSPLYFPTKQFQGRSKFARMQAAKNLMWLMASSYIVMGMYSVLGGDDDDVEYDLTSSDYGKLKKKNTRIDVTGGFASYLTLISRIFTNQRKSTTTRVKTTIGEDYGSGTGMDVIWDFIENKTSPFASLIKNFINRKNFSGEPLTAKNIITDMTVPIIIETGMETYDTEGVGMTLLALIADGLGLSANTYSYSGRWGQGNTKWEQQFKSEKGEKALQQAGKMYDKLVNQKIKELNNNKEFMTFDDDKKMSELTKEKNKIKKEVFKLYNFKVKSAK